MGNPWLKTNPLLSLWLSGANALTGRARSAGMAEMGRQRTRLTRQVTRSWLEAWFPTVGRKRARTKAR